MRNIKLTIEYDGTDYCGWQTQKKQTIDHRPQTIDNKQYKTSIQETIEKALQKILQEKIKLIGSGRTDAGVHALGQAANFKTNSRLNCTNIQRALNSILPADIRIKQARDAALDFHARFSAKTKFYRYTIVNDTFVSPFLYRHAHLVKCPLDVKKMQRVSRFLLGRHNFRSFQAVDKKEKSSIRSIKKLAIHKKKNVISVDIQANGFLYRMVRNIVGTLIEVGRGKLKAQDVQRILRTKNRIDAGPCAPAKGLCLIKVIY